MDDQAKKIEQKIEKEYEETLEEHQKRLLKSIIQIASVELENYEIDDEKKTKYQGILQDIMELLQKNAVYNLDCDTLFHYAQKQTNEKIVVQKKSVLWKSIRFIVRLTGKLTLNYEITSEKFNILSTFSE